MKSLVCIYLSETIFYAFNESQFFFQTTQCIISLTNCTRILFLCALLTIHVRLLHDGMVVIIEMCIILVAYTNCLNYTYHASAIYRNIMYGLELLINPELLC